MSEPGKLYLPLGEYKPEQDPVVIHWLQQAEDGIPEEERAQLSPEQLKAALKIQSAIEWLQSLEASRPADPARDEIIGPSMSAMYNGIRQRRKPQE